VEVVEHHIMVEGVRMKTCPECKSLYPHSKIVCLECGHDETCVCCILYGSSPQNCEPDCLHLDMYSAYDYGGKEES